MIVGLSCFRVASYPEMERTSVAVKVDPDHGRRKAEASLQKSTYSTSLLPNFGTCPAVNVL